MKACRYTVRGTCVHVNAGVLLGVWACRGVNACIAVVVGGGAHMHMCGGEGVNVCVRGGGGGAMCDLPYTRW